MGPIHLSACMVWLAFFCSLVGCRSPAATGPEPEVPAGERADDGPGASAKAAAVDVATTAFEVEWRLREWELETDNAWRVNQAGVVALSISVGTDSG